jgi:maltose O-acetyltransferase
MIDPLARVRTAISGWGLRPTAELLFNRVLADIPSNTLRVGALRALGADLGPHTYIFGGCEVLSAQFVHIAGNVHINRFCHLDGRGGLTIGRNVVIASRCVITTADHDVNDPGFAGRVRPVTLEDRVWLATRVTVVRGVTMGEGSVAAAGAVVTEDVEPWTVVGGVPARPIGERSREQHYTIDYGPEWY